MQTLDKKILSLALNDKKYAMELADATTHRYYDFKIQWLFVALIHYFKDPNIKSIPSRDMIKEYTGDDARAEKYLELYDEVKGINTDPSEFNWMLEKLRLRYNDKVQKETKDKIDELVRRTSPSKERVEKINALIKQSVVEIDSIRKRNTYKEGSLRDSATERAKRYEYLEAHPEEARGIMTGFSTFDRITNGLHAGEFMIVAGDTGTGKSIMMHNIAANAYLGKNKPFSDPKDWDDSGRNVLLFSLEMPKETMERRIDSCMAEIYSNHIRDGLLNKDDRQKYLKVLKFQKNYPKNFHIVDMPKGATAREIELKYLEICETSFRPDLVVVDYLGIMTSNDSVGSDWQDLGVISAELHEFARVYEVSVLTGSQVNRTKDGAERYDTSRIARSSMIPNNANIVLQIGCRQDEYLRTDMPIYIVKMRDGERNQFTLSKDFAKMKVIDLVDTTYADGDEDDDIL
jgi:replicative DNA helicase